MRPEPLRSIFKKPLVYWPSVLTMKATATPSDPRHALQSNVPRDTRANLHSAESSGTPPEASDLLDYFRNVTDALLTLKDGRVAACARGLESIRQAIDRAGAPPSN